MSDITIKIIEGFNGKTSEIIVDENTTIKELKKNTLQHALKMTLQKTLKSALEMKE